MANLVKQLAGPAGADGDPGPAGAAGSQIYVASGVPSNGLGVNGDFYIDSSNNFYYTKSAGTWTSQGQFIPVSLPSGGGTGQVLTKASNADFDAVWLTPSVSGTAGTLPWFRSSDGLLEPVTGWAFDPVYKGLSFGGTHVVGDNESGNFSTLDFEITPDENAPNSVWNMHNMIMRLKSADGFSLGSGGNAGRMFALTFDGQSEGNLGDFSFFQSTFDIGNGTDAIASRGFAYFLGMGQVAANVNLTGPLQGYIFQPSINASATMGAGGYISPFADQMNAPIALGPYSSFAANPVIGSIQNNANYTTLAANPNIGEMLGNSGVNGLSYTPNIGDFDTGGFNGVYINPVITSIQNAQGIYVNMSNVSGVNVKAIDVVGDVAIQGDLSFTGDLTVGKINAFFSQNVADGGGNPATIHGLITSIVAPAASTTANADTIGVNTAALITLGAGSTTTSGAFGLGLAALGLPAVIETHTGATLDFMHAALFAANFSGTSTGGTIDTLNLCRALVVPNASTTVNKLRGYVYDEPFGPMGTVRHAFYNVVDTPSYMLGALLIGGTPISDDLPENASVGLEINSTTKALLHARMTTTQRDSLTPVNGMEIYNLTVDKFQGYAAGAWVDLH